MKTVAGFLLLALAGASPAPAYDATVLEGMEHIQAGPLRAHMTFLAQDLLEGRETGTRGYELAASYVAAQFLAYGLEPAGDDGDYFQWIPFRRVETVSEAARFALVDARGDETVLVRDTDYIPFPSAIWPVSSLDAPTVFVGFGISAPEAGYDDYAGIDVTGKVVVLFRGGPPSMSHNQRAFFSTSANKTRTAVERGAVGMVVLFTREDQASRNWDRIVTNSAISSMEWLRPDGSPHGVYPEIEGGALLSQSGVEAVFRGKDMEAIYAAAETGTPNSFDLPFRVRMNQESTHSAARSCNVAGLLRGSDPVLQNQIIVYTAHLDHLGVGEPLEDGDRIYNGAYDNASGVAVLLEVARVLAEGPRPKRSFLFLAITGEEKGLLGSEYFAEYPTLPLETLIADVNLDMFLMLHPFRDVVAFGAEHSSLGNNVAEAARMLGVEVTPDPIPAEVIFVRSDQYNFVRKGVPSVFLWPGDLGVPDGEPTTGTWLREVYHSQKDDMNQYFDWEAGVTFARMNYLMGMDLSESPDPPAWNEGDFFGERFGTKRGAKK